MAKDTLFQQEMRQGIAYGSQHDLGSRRQVIHEETLGGEAHEAKCAYWYAALFALAENKTAVATEYLELIPTDSGQLHAKAASLLKVLKNNRWISCFQTQKSRTNTLFFC